MRVAPSVLSLFNTSAVSYTHLDVYKRQTEGGPLLRVVYKKVDSLENRWQKMADTCALIYPIIAKTFGPYPYKTYTFVQGGDGGMEYPMATLITVSYTHLDVYKRQIYTSAWFNL